MKTTRQNKQNKQQQQLGECLQSKWLSGVRIEPLFITRPRRDQRLRWARLWADDLSSNRILPVKAEALSDPACFRECLLNAMPGATFSGGIDELVELTKELNRMLLGKEVEGIGLLGFHEESGVIFCGEEGYQMAPSHAPHDKIRAGQVAMCLWLLRNKVFACLNENASAHITEYCMNRAGRHYCHPPVWMREHLNQG